MNALGPRRAGKLHRRIVLWFGLSILLAGLAAISVIHLFGAPAAPNQILHAQTFAAGRFARVWHLPAERDELGRAIHGELGLGVTLEDSGHQAIAVYGAPCARRPRFVPVREQGEVLGYVGLCWPGHHRGWVALLVLLAAGLTLWAGAGVLSRHLTRPLSELTRVAREIGSGRLVARLRLGRHHPNEVGELADAIHEMAKRIEQQLKDQRELLAAVSHELRTPLAHLRVLTELVREQSSKPELVDDMEREIEELNRLIDELLASSRLDFAALNLHSLRASQCAENALERAGLGRSLLVDEAREATFVGDATLIGRALANLLDNARRHGRGATALRLRRENDLVCFEVDDGGAGFHPEVLARAFDPFYRGADRSEASGSSLGLGLALVRRIAQAHRGRAWAENLAGGGARVGFSVKIAGPANAAG